MASTTIRRIARKIFGSSVEVLDLNLLFHKQATEFGAHGYLLVNSREHKLEEAPVRFFFRGLSTPPKMTPRLIDYIWEEAKAAGFTPIHLLSYGNILGDEAPPAAAEPLQTGIPGTTYLDLFQNRGWVAGLTDAGAPIPSEKFIADAARICGPGWVGRYISLTDVRDNSSPALPITIARMAEVLTIDANHQREHRRRMTSAQLWDQSGATYIGGGGAGVSGTFKPATGLGSGLGCDNAGGYVGAPLVGGGIGATGHGARAFNLRGYDNPATVVSRHYADILQERGWIESKEPGSDPFPTKKFVEDATAAMGAAWAVKYIPTDAESNLLSIPFSTYLEVLNTLLNDKQ